MPQNPADEPASVLLAGKIQAEKLMTFNKRELQRSLPSRHFGTLANPAGMDAALTIPIEASWERTAFFRQGHGNGRQSENYIVNPAIFE